MNQKTISQAKDRDLRLSFVALKRAAMRARELAPISQVLSLKRAEIVLVKDAEKR